MIKKIPSQELRVGMFIHELDCDWLSHPFLKNQFKLASDAQIEKVLDSGIHYVYIDTDKGLDVPDAPTEDEVRDSLQEELIALVTAEQPVIIHATRDEEIQRAYAIKGRAQALVRNVMADARLGRAVEVEQVDHVVENITESILRNSGAILGLLTIKNKDDYTFLHCVSVCALLVAFCRTMNLDAETTRLAGMGGLLHDTGKALVPDEVLNKPGKLTDEEFELIKRHPRDGYEILLKSPEIGPIPLDITLHHHERMDGNGYPDKLKPEQIPQLVRMSSIVDVYDAITADRCYHRGIPATDALRKLHEWSAFHFDPKLVQAFIRCVGIYPVGALVKLESGRLGVVLEQNDTNLLQPRLKVIFNAKTGHRVEPYDLDLSRPMGSGGADRIVGHEDPAKWKLDTQPFISS
ncbi:HD-GYP domain-containing protein [Uliginosibacterium aquaticum]|uniref:HD-GYP domain-containing protein n=1 Tax=Uliginosibacterium aquaticum TaxID=2731212 RepID=A0ABX2IHW9_9RHOO|nr:HD-GYP domain-containing protein [Uliginosibacterium aquaticum]NSL56419.1 HD-GYP domain-containing protein [Uliginosibacterium aquaticum]